MKASIQKYIRWISFILGSSLLLFAFWSTYDMLTPEVRIEGTITPVADQEGFAPIVVPENTPSSKIFEPTEVPIAVEPKIIIIEKIELEAPVLHMDQISVKIAEQNYAQFLVPEKYAVGWHAGSAPIGIPGNTVFSGHHNAYGAVFKDLKELEVGDVIKLMSEEGEEYKYIVSNKMIYREKEEDLETRLENGRWIQSTDDERLTLVTCWPEDSNSHRLIIVAVPKPDYSMYDEQPPQPDYLAAIDLKTPVVLHLVQQTVTPHPADACVAYNISPYGVNIRANPSLNGEIIGGVTPGSEAKCVARNEDGTWIKVFFDGVEGWISTDVVELQMDVNQLPFYSEE